MWLIGAVFYFYAFFQRTAPSAMVPELMTDFQVSAVALGQLSAYYFYAYAAMQIPTGILADYWGPKRLLLGAAALSGVGSLLFATAEGMITAAIGRLLIGAGAGFGFVSTLKIAAEWFPPRRLAMLSGLTMTFGMAGGIAGQAPLAAGISLFGWRPIMLGAAAIALVGCVVIILVFRNRPPKLQDRGFESVSGASRTLGLQAALKRPQTWFIAGFGFAIVTVMFAFGGLWGVPYLMQVRGLSRVDAAFAASLILLGWGCSAPALGWLSDRIGRRRPMLLASAFLATVSIGVLLYTPGLALAAINLLLLGYGIAVGGIVVCFAAVREHNAPEDAGAAMAIVNMAIIASGAVMQPLVGWLLDLGWQGGFESGGRLYDAAAYQTAFLVLPASGVFAFLLAMFVRESPTRPQA
jgi:MFS family permease